MNWVNVISDLKKIEDLIQSMHIDATLYTESDVHPSCKVTAMKCFLLELQVISLESGDASIHDTVENLIILANNSLSSNGNVTESGCKECEELEEKNIKEFLQSFVHIVQMFINTSGGGGSGGGGSGGGGSGSMKSMLVVTISIWLILAPTSTWAVNTIIYNVGSTTISKYATFLNDLRNEAKDPSLKCYGIPMLPNTNTNPKYVLVELQGSNKKTITLMLRRNNLYVMGYSDPFETNKCRYHIFNDISGTERQDVETTLCPNANSRVSKNINFDSRYPTLESKAGVKSRSQVQLGIQILDSNIGKISGVMSFTEKTEAEFLLVAIQMVSEAARFKYIENQVKTNFNRAFNPNPKVLNLQETWGKISTAIHDAKNGVLPKPLELVDASGAKWIVLRVDEIKPDVALLNYVGGSCQTTYNQNAMFPQLIMSTYYNYMVNLGDLFEGF
nr:hIL15/PAP fusion protein [synthetic construct]